MNGQFAVAQVKNGEYLELIDSIRIHFVVKGKGPVLLAGHPTSGKIAYQMSLQPLEEKFMVVYYDSREWENRRRTVRLTDISMNICWMNPPATNPQSFSRIFPCF